MESFAVNADRNTELRNKVFGHYIVSFRRFFNDRWFKTLLLFSITTFWQSVVILFGFLVILVVSLLQL